jgi:IS5 family transposase
MRIAQNKKRARAKTEEQKAKRDTSIVNAHQEYIDVSQKYLDKVFHTLNTVEKQGLFDVKDILLIENIKVFIDHAVRQISQIERRVIFGEIIPHDEKVFSLFQPHTEWVMKGKAGVPVELGVTSHFS